MQGLCGRDPSAPSYWYNVSAKCKSTNLSYLEDMETVKFNLDTALRNAIKEINERMVSIETDIKRIRKAREGEKEQRRRVRREVVTYYEGYSEKVS